MEDPTNAPIPFPKPPQGWWEQVPVLNELYKLLSSNDPVNWELARQIGVAIATFDEQPVNDLEGAGRELEGMSRAAQVEAENFTGLVTEALAPVSCVSRAQWVEANLVVFKQLMEPLATKLTGSSLPMDIPIPLPPQAMQMVKQVGGVLMGVQAGFVLGYMARHVIGQYELVLPDPTGGRLLFVTPNMQTFEAEWGLDHTQFGYWMALHEATHHLEFSRPWARKYFHAQITSIIDSLNFDPSNLSSALEGFDIGNPESMMDALSDPEQLMKAAWTPAARDAVGRLQAFMTLAEGYSAFVMDAVGARVLTDHPRLREVLDRRKRSDNPGEQLLNQLLGVELKKKQYDEGVKFCRYVAGVRDIEALNRVWNNPESLPTEAELADPEIWITRVLTE